MYFNEKDGEGSMAHIAWTGMKENDAVFRIESLR